MSGQLVGQPILQLMDVAELWNRVSLPHDDFYRLVSQASENVALMQKRQQGDPIRLLQAASVLATDLLKNNTNLVEAKQIIGELGGVQDQLYSRHFRRWSRERKVLLRRQKMLQQRAYDYFRAIKSRVAWKKCTYGFLTGKLQTIELTIIQPKCQLIRQNLLQLQQLLPA